MLPLTAALFVMGDTGVNFLYGRGDFGPHSIVQTTYCLWAYGIGLIPSAFVLILAPVSYAQSNYRLPALASFLTMLLNMLLNGLFIMVFGWGAISVATATSISAWMNFLILGWSLSKTDHPLFFWSVLKKGIPMCLATTGALWGTYQVRITFQNIPFFSETLLSSSSFTEQFAILSYQILAFGGLLLLGLNIFRLVSQPLFSPLKIKN